MTEPATDDAEPGTVGSAAWWRLWQLRQARRRPRADGLTVERIIAVALAIVDAEGLDALTVRRIADQLGTGSATLYRHYTSREELLELLVDHVIGEVRLPPPELGWRSKVEHLSGELRRALMEHANLVPALARSPLLGPNAKRGADNGLASLLEAGHAPDVAVLACRALLDYVLGTVFFDTSRVGRGGPPDRDGLDLLAQNPAQRAIWQGDVEGVTATAVEEIVRMASPVTFMRRTVTHDLTLSGHDFAEGDKLVLFYGAANRDPRVFDDPDTFDVRRDPNPHVGFGGPGPHFCLGAHLARRELSIIFRQLFARLPDIEVVGEPVHLAAMGIPLVGGIKHLPVRFTPTAPVRSR